MANQTRAEKVKEIIYEQLKGWQNFSLEDATPEKSLVDDLGADSLDLVELVMEVEEAFSCEISDEEAEKLVTVQDCLDFAARLSDA